MKKILICIQFLLLTTVAYATGQDSDVIYYCCPIKIGFD